MAANSRVGGVVAEDAGAYLQRGNAAALGIVIDSPAGVACNRRIIDRQQCPGGPVPS